MSIRFDNKSALLGADCMKICLISFGQEKNQLQRRANAEEEIVLARQAAKEYLSQSESITIQLSPHDVSALEARAEESGIPYPTLISTLVHQYITGKIQMERQHPSTSSFLPSQPKAQASQGSDDRCCSH